MKKMLIACVLLVAAGGALAKDSDDTVYPYKDEGPAREMYLQLGMKGCTELWKKVGTEKEVHNFCSCRVVVLADTLNYDDTVATQQWSQGIVKQVPKATFDKFGAANVACKQHLKSLPDAPARH